MKGFVHLEADQEKMNENKKFAPSNIFEGMTSISAVINHYETNGRKIEKIWFDRTKTKSKASEFYFLKAKSQELGFSLETVDSAQLDEITLGNTHGGIVAFCTERSLPVLEPTLINPNGFYVFLEGIEDPYNFGNTIRSLYAAGVDGVVLPPRNWMNAAGVVARASAGTSESIPMFVCESDTVASLFHDKGYQILCAGIRDSVSIFEESFEYPILLVIGGEKRGISRNILNSADQIVRIDYGREFRGSLSASASAAVLAFAIYAQHKKQS